MDYDSVALMAFVFFPNLIISLPFVFFVQSLVVREDESKKNQQINLFIYLYLDIPLRFFYLSYELEFHYILHTTNFSKVQKMKQKFTFSFYPLV